MSTDDIKSSYYLGWQSRMSTDEQKLEENQFDWLYGADRLDGLCEPYGYGKGVVGTARSITIEDIDKITGYNKLKYGEGTLSQYSNEVTYSYNGTTNPKYTSATANGTLTETHSIGFHYYNGSEFITSNLSTAVGTIIILTNNYYCYNASELTTINSVNNAKAYSMIFNGHYWLASPYTDTKTNYVDYGIRYVMFYPESVNAESLWDSCGGTASGRNHGVRAVVTLSSDIQLKGDSTNGWSY